jgi:hypothetical protein
MPDCERFRLLRVASFKEERPMSPEKLEILDGPDKPGLQRSLTLPGKCIVHFTVEGNAFDAQILRMDETSDSLIFELKGHLTSGDHKDWPFDAIYSVQGRTGWMVIRN